MTIQVAFDIGGTFTDFVLQDRATGQMVLAKTLSTPENAASAVLSGMRTLLKGCNIDVSDVRELFHASTVATNAILERKGSRTALLTTKGFRDVILIGRQKRYDTFDLYMRKPTPLIQRRYVYEITERVLFDGSVREDVNLDSVDAALAAIAEQGIESVAIAFLHAYANPVNERIVADRIREKYPQLTVSLSSEVSPKIREYERVNTTVANAYVKPIVQRYLRNLDTSLRSEGLSTSMHIMQSNGGLVTPEIASEFPIRIVESGPAAGVLMCRQVAADEGFTNAISFDMGGTTAKIGAIDAGEPAITTRFEVDAVYYRPYSGLPLNISAIELLEIGAGGGSIASTDGRTLRVGPQSAGASPGPICYGCGGLNPTLTDANLVLGYLNPEYFNGGAMMLDLAGARAGIAECIAKPLGVGGNEAAWGIHAFANSNMERAMRVVSVERGRDPRNYCMVAFGGAGPIHATRLARAMAIPTVIVPFGAGVGSAVGLLMADARLDVSQTHILTLSQDILDDVIGIYEDLTSTIAKDLNKLKSIEGIAWSRYAYMRLVGQGFEIRVAIPDGSITPAYLLAIKVEFHRVYEKEFGYSDHAAAIEVVDWCLAASIPAAARPPSSTRRVNNATTNPGLTIVRTAFFPESGGLIECPILTREQIKRQKIVVGPAIVEDPETTILICKNDRAWISERGNLIISIEQETKS